MKSSLQQKGNVLFIILIAIALFAALSYAVTSSNRTTEGTLSKYKARIAAAQLIQFATEVEQGVRDVMFYNKCKDTELSFHTPVFKNKTNDTPIHAVHHNPNAPLDKSCNIYDPAGGRVIAHLIPGIAITNQTSGGWRTGHSGTVVAAVVGAGSDENDLLLTFPHIREEVCMAINEKMNIASSPLPTDSVSIWKKYDGDYSGVTGFFGDNATDIANKSSFCTRDAGNNNAGYFYHILVAR